MLVVWNKEEFNIKDYFDRFKRLCKDTKYFQGDGWGIFYLENGEFKEFKSSEPIWGGNFEVRARLAFVHARFASKKSTIGVGNNMPFMKDGWVFMFNGFLRGVKLDVPGRIGAEKVFNIFLEKVDDLGLEGALKEVARILGENSDYIRGMNIVVGNKDHVGVLCKFNEDEEYFTMKYGRGIVCSGDLDTKLNMENNEVRVFDVSG
tara:strand:- start:3339 stop:3953 length:615 start_codon:yes stop_codon:yes gene_type:complete